MNTLYLTIFFYVFMLVFSSVGFAWFVHWLLTLPKRERVINDERTMRALKRREFARREFRLKDGLRAKIVNKISELLWKLT